MQFKIFIKKKLKNKKKNKKKLFIILRKISTYFYPNQLLNPLSNSNLSTKVTVFFLLINYYIFIFHNKIIQNLDKHESRMPKSLRHSERTIAKETLLLRIQLVNYYEIIIIIQEFKFEFHCQMPQMIDWKE